MENECGLVSIKVRDFPLLQNSVYPTQLGLSAQDLVCKGQSPFQTVIPSLVCVHWKESSNELGVLRCIVKTHS